jgi:F-type H+-transporting ATPase subunit b
MSALATLVVLAADDTTKFEAPNKWLPEGAEILWGTLAFVIIVVLLWKFARLPIQKSLRDRTARIGKEIDSAATARADAEAELDQVRQNLANIDTERARIVSDATQSGESIRADGFVRNDAEVVELETRAEADIEASRGRAASDLQAQVAAWASEVTERAVVAHLDDAAQQRLIEDFIAKVGASA